MNHYQGQQIENMYNGGSFGTDISMLNNSNQVPYQDNYIVPYSNAQVDSGSNIPQLVFDINKSLENYTIDSPHSIQDEDVDILRLNEDLDDNNDYDDEDKNVGWLESIPFWLKEIFIFIIIYFIFSMGTVKNTIGSYIKYINPDSNGNVSFVGVIIYGLLLICTIILVRYFVV